MPSMHQSTTFPHLQNTRRNIATPHILRGQKSRILTHPEHDLYNLFLGES